MATENLTLSAIDLTHERITQALATVEILGAAVGNDEAPPCTDSIKSALWGVEALLEQAKEAVLRIKVQS